MERKEYSAGAVKLSFWFMEFRKVVELRGEGKTYEDIKRLSQEKNLFATSTPARAKQICSTVTTRVQSLDESFYPVFLESDLATQKLFNLVAIMATDALFFDFVYEVVREKLIIGSNELSDSDVRIFFKDKQIQDEKTARWTDETLNRLGRCYKTLLYEAGITDKVSPTGRQGESDRARRHSGVEDGLGHKAKETRKIFRPILDPMFERWLNEHDMGVLVKALTGVR
ncbi:MAG: DUF1819 family protein [Clostridiales bacterium]|nr:DUF1819 family protein [Clostridiales bacterium]